MISSRIAVHIVSYNSPDQQTISYLKSLAQAANSKWAISPLCCSVPRSIEFKTRSCNELTSGCHFGSFGRLCVQFKVVVFTGVNSLSLKCLAAVHQTARAGLKMLYGSLAFLQTAKGPKMATYINRKLARCTTCFLLFAMLTYVVQRHNSSCRTDSVF